MVVVVMIMNDTVTDPGSETDVVVLGYDAQEDTELCTQRPREASDGECWSRRRG